MTKWTSKVSVDEIAKNHMMSKNTEGNESITSMAEETLQMIATETADLPSVLQVSTDSNDKAMFAKPYLQNKASDTQSIDICDSTSGQDTQSVGHVESQPSASITLSSTVNVFVHIGSCPKSPRKFIPSSPENRHSSIKSYDSVSIGDSQYISRGETQSSALVPLSSTVHVVHFGNREDVAEPRQYTMPTRKTLGVEDQKTIKSMFERQSVSSDSGTRVYGKETREEIVRRTPMNKNLSSEEIEVRLNKPAVEESLVRTKVSADTREKNLIVQVVTENKMPLKEQLEVDKSKVRLSLKYDDERKTQLREVISTKSKMFRKQEASGSKLQQDPDYAAANEQAAANTESNLQLSPDFPEASSETSYPTPQLPEASPCTQQAPSRYPPRKVKLTADSLPSWKNMTMVEARRGRGMYGSRLRQYGENSPPKEKRTSAFTRDLPEITVQNINRGIRGRRFQKLLPSQTGLPPYRSMSERLFLETMAKVVDVTKERKKKTKKKRRPMYTCAEEMDEDSWTSGSSSDNELKSPKKSPPPSPELQFNLEL